MCVTNIYVDQFPDGRTVEFRSMDYCPYGQPNRPCQKLSTIENPVRKINFGEPTSEFIMTAQQRVFPQTPPRSPHHRYSGGSNTSEEGRRRRHSHNKRQSELFPLKPHRQHRIERIVIVDSPPTPRTPPQAFRETFTAPSSPIPFIIDGHPRESRRPIIVDERRMNRPRTPSVGAAINDRPRRPRSPVRFWDTPSSSHTSFDSRARREAEELERLQQERMSAERRKLAAIAAHDEDIRRRPAVPIPPAPLRHRPFLRPVIDQSQALQGLMGDLTIDGRAGERALMAEAEARRRREERDRVLRAKKVEEEDEALKQRLRERQMPKRRFSVGPGNRRHRVVYDNGVYRWE